MTLIIWLTFICAALFLTSCSIFIMGITQKSRKLIYRSFIPASLFTLTVAYLGYVVFLKSANYLNKALESRTDQEIYQYVLGKSNSECSEILNFQDKEFPILDFAIVIHFKTCKEELERILKTHTFSKSYVPTTNWDGDIPTGVKLYWLNPKAMGDTIMVYEYSTNNGQYIKTLWTSMDSTEVYCRLIN
jgi:hypothetical protein